jgi:hypothetical protein
MEELNLPHFSKEQWGFLIEIKAERREAIITTLGPRVDPLSLTMNQGYPF